MLAFLLCCVLGVAFERSYLQSVNGKKRVIWVQRGLIFLLHLSAFLILTFAIQPPDLEMAFFAVAGLLFLLFSFVTAPVVFKNSCQLIWNSVFFLFDIGLITIARLNLGYAQKQLIIAAGAYTVAMMLPLFLKIIPKFQKLKYLYMGVSIALLSSLFVLAEDNYGAINWIDLGGIGFQPSEFVKFLFVLALASSFHNAKRLRSYFIPCLFGASVVLILIAQNDLGGALIFFMTFMVMLYAANGKKIIFLLGITAFVIACFAAYRIFPHVSARFDIWLNPWSDMEHKGYQITQSLFAITTWGLLGSGLTMGSSALIPFVEKDVIFSAICEEFGSLFGICLVFVFIFIFYRGVHIALRCLDADSDNPFLSLTALGLTGILAFQTFVILGGSTAFLPLTGVTLPLVSYGGSSVAASFLMIGLLQWIYIKTYRIRSCEQPLEGDSNE